MTLVLLILLIAGQPTCQDLSSCREQAIAAKDAGDFEAFHDLAWATLNQGKKNDPELMLLVARAQSLSGRPGDALVMLERIAALGAPTDALTSEDFARVRALPRWAEVADKFEASAKDPVPAISASEEGKPPAKDPDTPAKTAKPAIKPEPEKPEPAKKPEPEKKPEPSPKPPTPRPAESKVVPPPTAEAPNARAKDAPLAFTTVLTPEALAYDAVSRRFVIADRKARRVAIVDEHTGQVSTLVGEQGGLGEIGGMAIDPQQGDLWVVSTGDDDAPALHRVQLISGRVVSSVPLKKAGDPAALAFVRGTGLVLADTTGAVFVVDRDGSTKKLGALEYVPHALGSDPRGRLYISGGAARIGRYTVAGTLRRVGIIELDGEVPPGVPFVVADGRLHFVVPVGGRFEMRSFALK